MAVAATAGAETDATAVAGAVAKETAKAAAGPRCSAGGQGFASEGQEATAHA